MAIRILYNVAQEEVAGVEEMFRSTGATNVVTVPEGDGEYTVTGYFPDRERHAEFAARLAVPPAGDGGG